LLKACDPNSTITAEEFEQTQLASDIHRRTASLMFGVEPAKVAKVQRQAVKSITFGLTYGMGTETLAANNGWTLEEAEEKVDMFFSAFPDLKKWLENNPKIAREKGYVETMMGRRRRLDIFYSKENFRLKAKADRLSMNAPIQGQSSDGGTIGLFQFLQFLLDNNLEKRWLVQNVVHDSCLVQVPMDDIDDALKAMQYHFVDGMSDYIKQYFGFTLPLPIECEIEVGIKYGDLTKWDGRPSTLPSLKEKLKEDAKVLWYTKKEKTGKPAKDLDLVKWQGK
jgi:DNA polymerase-1